ncbi:potassium transporter [Neorhizobium sp. SOG26]|uniref:TrkH family potassium uptake protein n=1 Tax=Neorhizobium sp. SOG26 TaxID=2060726 RepID=UPI000E588458|nr:TrkH family potassium uptake protein [Neorhizobium sp. SOG26]AXV15224.1 potassium transporter [Neorhizobium sp. SOG26]
MNANLIRSVIYITALCALYLSMAMFLPALVDLYYGHRDWQVFALSGFLVGGIAGAAALATRGPPPAFNKRFGFLLVNVLWLMFSLVGAIPLFLAEYKTSFAQALFESISGITTTGSTIMVGLDKQPPGILLWRSLLCWLGGIGIVGLGLFVLPFLKVGGASIFKLESTETNDKPFARLASFTRAFLAVYILLTIACTVAYDVAGMSHFDALNHALSTVATAGFSTHDASFAFWKDNQAILVICTIFLTISSLPFSVLILLAMRGRLDTLRDPQIMVFLGYLGGIAVALGVYHHLRNSVELDDALIHSFFNIASILSTGGFSSDDYTLWGPFAVMLVFFASAMGGCSGSTSGGIKSYRFVVMFNTARAGINKLIYPNAIYPVRYGTLIVDADTQRGVFLFLGLFLFLWVLGSLGMTLLGYDVVTSFSGVLTCLANVGPGIGPIIGPVGNFSTISDPALYLLSVLMLLGRLEILTVLVLLTPIFWRH